MAQQATVHRVSLEVSDLDRNVYGSHALTVARHPSETEERLMVRLVAFSLFAPEDAGGTTYGFAGALCDEDTPDLAARTLSGELLHWIDLGTPDERRVLRAAGRATAVSLLAYRPAARTWWEKLEARTRALPNLRAFALDPAEVRALGALAAKHMAMAVTVQEGTVFVSVDGKPCELHLERLPPDAQR